MAKKKTKISTVRSEKQSATDKARRGKPVMSWQKPPKSVAMPAGMPNPIDAIVDSLDLPKPKYKDRTAEKYSDDMPGLVEMYVDFGLTENQIAQLLGIAIVTLWKWKQRYPAFAKALELTQERANRIVEKSLFLRATGYSHPAIKIMPPDASGKPVIVPYTEYYPPDTSAAALWLHNRDPKRWKRRGFAPAEDQAPHGGNAEVRAKARQEAFAVLGQLLEERARAGLAPLFAQNVPRPGPARVIDHQVKTNGKKPNGHG